MNTLLSIIFLIVPLILSFEIKSSASVLIFLTVSMVAFLYLEVTDSSKSFL